MEKDKKQMLHNMYNATSTDDGTGNDKLETYENWLERQLLSRIEKIEQLDLHSVSQQRELLSWMKENHHLGKTEEQINELLLDYNFEQLNCG